MMSGIFILVFATILAATYGSLRRAATAGTRAALKRATQQVARNAEGGIGTSTKNYRSVGNDSAARAGIAFAAKEQTTGIETHLPASLSADLSTALARLRAQNDSGAPIELWTANGRRVGFLGKDRLKAERSSPEDPLPHPGSFFPGLDAIAPSDTLQVGKLFVSENHVRYWIVLPVLDNDSVVGYVAKQSAIAVNPASEKGIRALAGEPASMYFHNADGTGWTTVAGKVTTASTVASNQPGIRRRPEGGDFVSEQEQIGGTPFVVSMEYPVADILAGPRNVVRSLAVLSLVLLFVGTLASWTIARRITDPLRTITQAATAISQGDYRARVPPAGDLELVRLAESFNEMVDQISDGREALEKQTSVARSASRAKTDFLATMSHELRTPLNAIGGYVELLEMELRGPVTETQRRDLTRIRIAQQHVLGLISSMLDLSRIEAGRVAYDLQPVALDSFLAGLDGLVAPQAATKSFALDYIPTDPTLGVLADREKLRQIILNLLSNAIRHTPSGGRITLDAEALDAERVAIHVRDTGPGVPEAKQEEIFEPFVQLDRSLAQPREGVGLGLAISRDLARGMHGDLTMNNQPTGGACFTLTLRRTVVTDGAVRMAFTGEMPVDPSNAKTLRSARSSG